MTSHMEAIEKHHDRKMLFAKVKRYLVFAGYDYYPSGGWNDYVASFDDLNMARDTAKGMVIEWAHIIDITTGKKVYEYTKVGYQVTEIKK